MKYDPLLRASAVPAVVLISIFLSWFEIKDPDVFWHLKIGEVIVADRSLVRTNSLSSLFPDQPWDNPEWLFQAVLAMAYNMGGWLGVALLKVSLAAAVVGTLYLAVRKQGAARPAAVGLVLAAVAASRFRITERPHLVSLFFFTVVVLLVEKYRRNEGGHYSLVFPALFSVWSNLHPGLIFGLLHISIVGLADLLLPKFGWRGSSGRGKGLMALLLLSAGASLLNPLGYKVLTYGWEQREFHRILGISEFTSSHFSAHPLFYLLVLLFVLAVFVNRRADVPMILSALAFLVLGMLYQRSIPEFSVVGIVVIARAMEGKDAYRRGIPLALTALSLALLSVAWSLGWDRNYPYRFGHGPLESSLPANAADFLVKEGVPENLYNDYASGGYLAFRLYPRYRVFQDGRIPAYPRDFFLTPHQQVSGSTWASRLSRFKINSAVVEIPRLKALFPDETWALVSWDDKFAVVVRRSLVSGQFLERLEYRYYTPFASMNTSVTWETFRRIEYEMSRNLRERRTPSWKVLVDLAQVKSSSGDSQDAMALLARAEGIVPSDKKSLETLARAWTLAGRPERSAEVYRRMQRQDQ